MTQTPPINCPLFGHATVLDLIAHTLWMNMLWWLAKRRWVGALLLPGVGAWAYRDFPDLDARDTQP